VKSLATSEQQDRRHRGSHGDPIGQRQGDYTEQVGVNVEQQDHEADIRPSLLVTFANMLGVEDSEPRPEYQQTAGERKEMDGIEEVQHASGKRQDRECADPSSAFRCRVGVKILECQAEKKLSPKSRPRFTAEGAAFIGAKH
jgi:hypothetical protein